MVGRVSRWVWLVAAIAVALAFPVLLGGQDMLGRLRSFPLPTLAALFGLICLCWMVNAWRLRLLLGEDARQLGGARSIGVVMATEFAICATPGGSGGPLTLMALLHRNGVRPAKSSAVFAMDQLSDLLFFLCALFGIIGYALFHNLSDRLEWMLIASAMLLSGLLGSCWAIAHNHRRVIALSGRFWARMGVSHHRRWRWARRTLHFVAAFGETFRMPRCQLAQVFALTCLHWGLRYSVLYFVLEGLGAHLQWAWSFLIQMVSMSAGQFSLLPGGAGAAELTSAALLAPIVGKSTAAAAILIWRMVTYYFYLLAGGPVFLVLVGKPLLKRLMRFRQA